MDDKQVSSERQANPLNPQEYSPAGQHDQQKIRDSRGRRLFDDDGEPIHWATPAERVIAFVLALVVIAITLAFVYSLSTGDLFRR